MFIFLNGIAHFFTSLRTPKNNTHRGELLKAAVAASPMKITELTKRMGISRGTYYNHILDPDLSLDLLERYGKALHYDFTQDVPRMKHYTLEEPERHYGEPGTLQEAIAQRDYWRELYYKTLQQLNQVLLKRELDSE
jgi:hypothetical protein